MSKLLAVAAVVGALLAASTPANAVITTFAAFAPIGPTANVLWTNSAGARATGTGGTMVSTATGTSSAEAARQVKFSFLDPVLAPHVTDAIANFTLIASAADGSPAVIAAAYLDQSITSGSFSFKTTAPMTVRGHLFAAGSNLLTGVFGGTDITGLRGSSRAAFAGGTPAGDTLTYTSDFLSFSDVINESFEISLAAVTGPLNAVPTTSTPTAALRNFRAVAGGTFSSDPAPDVKIPDPAGVPEPASWALMMGGMGLVGTMLRRRPRPVPSSAA